MAAAAFTMLRSVRLSTTGPSELPVSYRRRAAGPHSAHYRAFDQLPPDPKTDVHSAIFTATWLFGSQARRIETLEAITGWGGPSVGTAVSRRLAVALTIRAGKRVFTLESEAGRQRRNSLLRRLLLSERSVGEGQSTISDERGNAAGLLEHSIERSSRCAELVAQVLCRQRIVAQISFDVAADFTKARPVQIPRTRLSRYAIDEGSFQQRRG